MPSFLNFNIQASNAETGRMRIPITTQTVPTPVSDYASAVIAAAIGTGSHLMFGGYTSVSLEIVLPGVSASPVAECDIRNKWQATMIDASGDIFRFGMPTRNPLKTLLSFSRGIVGDSSLTAFTATVAALVGASTVHMVNPETNALLSEWGPVLSNTRSRKRPRQGGSR
jgi:hypothetical protein